MNDATPSTAAPTRRAQLVRELLSTGESSEAPLQALLRLTASQCGTPWASLSLADGDRERCIAALGMPCGDGPLDGGFLDAVLAASGVFVVDNVLQDARFAFGASVPGNPGVRFCAGVAIELDGVRIGALLAMDRRALELGESAREGLRDLARLASGLLQERLIAQRAATRQRLPVATDDEAMRATEERAAELAHVAKSEFLSRMSHEMRTPLNAVIGFTQLLLSRPEAPDAKEVRDYAEHVLRAGEHLLNLTNDVLDLQHVEEGRVELDTDDVPLDRVVTAVIEQLAPAAEARGVSFDNHVGDGIAVRADERRLRQVLHNVASNAVKYNRPAGVVRWSAAPGTGDGRVRLSIEDTGSGLKPAQLERLFQPFERLGKETSTIEGTGLGLIIARSLARAMGATLHVASTAGVGTRVVIDLPMASQSTLPFTQPAELDDDPAREGAELIDDAPDATPAPALRMLYVEDNRINAILFEEAIRLRDNVELRLAEDGTEALDQVRDWKPDVLVLDAHLPGIDGFALLDVLRAQPGLDDVPAFMCSADAMPDDVQRAAQAGFAGYWSKPINIAKIMSDLDRVSAGRPTGPANELS